MHELGALAVAGKREHCFGTGREGTVDERCHLLSARAGAACEETGYGSVVVDALDGKDARPIHICADSGEKWRAGSLAEVSSKSSQAVIKKTCIQSYLSDTKSYSS